jgi:hypothetical protein
MAIEPSLVATLTGDATVAALVGSRVYPTVAKRDATLPLIVYQRITTDRYDSLATVADLAAGRFQVACWADSYAGASALADAVRAALDHQSLAIDYVVAGSLTPDATGQYTQSGTYASQPAYESADGSYWLWHWLDNASWRISSSKGEESNFWESDEGGPIEDTYVAIGSVSGSPTVAAGDGLRSVCRVIDEGDLSDISPDEVAARRYGRRLDVQVWHRE